MSISSKFWGAIKSRDWGAAIIEIGIVAIGILMALAVENWRVERENYEKERAILSRTHEQVYSVIESNRDFWNMREEFIAALHAARNLVWEGIPNRALSDLECPAIAYAHRVEFFDFRIPSIEELLASGSLSAIHDPLLREVALTSIEIRDEQVARARVWNAKTTNLVVDFPDILIFGIAPTDDPTDEDGFHAAAKSDLPGMRLNQKFKNSKILSMTTFSITLRAIDS